MSARITEDSKFSPGDLVEITQSYKIYYKGSYVDIRGRVGKVLNHYRNSKHGAHRWAAVILWPDNTSVTVYTKYKFTDSPLRPVFKA